MKKTRHLNTTTEPILIALPSIIRTLSPDIRALDSILLRLTKEADLRTVIFHGYLDLPQYPTATRPTEWQKTESNT